jgi:SAM-dependent methyltransferase
MTPAVETVCYLCGGRDAALEAPRTRDRADIQVMRCTRCSLVYLSSAAHITPDFYEESGMHGGATDLAKWREDTAPDDERRARACEALIRGRRMLDFGCGNGAFLLRTRHLTAASAGVDLEAAAAGDLRASGIDYASSIDALDGTFDVITMFHVLEHLPDPRATLRQLGSRLSPGGEIVIEVPSADDALLKLYRCEPFKAFTYWSCHLFLFTAETLRALFDQAGATTRSIAHVQRYPLSNHLYWLARGQPGGHKAWNFLDTPAITAAYEAQLAARGLTDTLFASVSFAGGHHA